jgi:hypothetical protein
MARNGGPSFPPDLTKRWSQRPVAARQVESKNYEV